MIYFVQKAMGPSTIISELGNNNNNNVAPAAFLCHISLLQLVATLIKFQYFIVIQLFGRILCCEREFAKNNCIAIKYWNFTKVYRILIHSLFCRFAPKTKKLHQLLVLFKEFFASTFLIYHINPFAFKRCKKGASLK